MISLRSALEQSTWADEKLFNFLSTLPDEAWRAKATDDEWHVAALTFHLIASADWYRYQLGGARVFFKDPESIAEVRALGPTWKEINEFLLSQASEEDDRLTWEEDGVSHTEMRSTILTEVIIHSVEHRVQIAAALKLGGHAELKLEDYSAWGYSHRPPERTT